MEPPTADDIVPGRPISDQWRPHWLVRVMLGASFAFGFGTTLIGVGWKLYSESGYELAGFLISGVVGLIISGWLAIPISFALYSNLPWLSNRVCKGKNLLWSVPAHFAIGALLGLVPFAFLGVKPSPPPCAL